MHQVQSGIVAHAGAGSEQNMHAVQLFSSFFVPFCFFAKGAEVPAGAWSLEGLLIGLGLTIVLVRGGSESSWRSGAGPRETPTRRVCASRCP